jgi:primase-polymerase (primpol)-like protein
MSFNTRQFIFPPGLVERDQWIAWTTEMRDGKETKVPINPETEEYAKSNESKTWTDFDTADETARSSDDYGLGFVFTHDDPFVGVDLDDVRDPKTGAVDEDARFIIEQINSYTELSPSDTGYHIIAKGSLPPGRKRHGGVEMYEHGRFFTMSANHVDGSPQEAEPRTQQLRLIHEEFVAKDEDEEERDTDFAGGDADPTNVNMSDKQVIQKAKNSARGEKFQDLWNGNWQKHGYESQSEADLALACQLAFWTGGDPQQVHRMFKDSDLYRPKWDEQHFSDGATYGERTVEKAVKNQSDFYGS